MHARWLALALLAAVTGCGGGGAANVTPAPPQPAPALASPTFSPSPAAITGGTSPSLSFTLPALTSAAASAATVSLTVSSGGAPVAVGKSGGGAVGVGDLGTTITVDAPSTGSTDSKTFTYTLTVSNSATPPVTATASGTITVLPTPTISSGTFAVSPGAITGGTAPTLSLTLPALTSVPASAATVSLTVSSGGPPVAVGKSGGGPVGVGDLGTTITVSAPSTAPTDSKTFTYTLTVSNSATTPASASASGALTIVPTPTISSGTFAVSPGVITGGTAPSLSLTLPALTSAAASAATVSLTVSSGGAPVLVTKTSGGGGSVQLGDLGTFITVNAPSTGPTDSKTFTYLLTVSNSATTPASASASGAVLVVPAVALGGGFSVVPNVLDAGTSTPGLLQFALPTVVAGTATSVALTASSGGAPASVTKTGGSPIVLADLGGTIGVDPPATSPTATLSFTYALTGSDAAGTPSSPATTVVSVLRAQNDLASQRAGATATVLPNGKILVAGGGSTFKNGVCTSPTSSAELYDPSTGAGAAVPGAMVIARCQHAALLSGTRVYLIGGGTTGTAADLKIDVYDATNNVFLPDAVPSLPTLATARIAPTATLLGPASGGNSGKIVIAGGYTAAGAPIASLELFDPAGAGLGSSALYSGANSALAAGRAEHSATLVGKWLYILGGSTTVTTIDALDTTLAPIAGNPITRTTSPANAIVRVAHGALALDTSSLLVAGGMAADGLTPQTSVQVYTLGASGLIASVSVSQSLATRRARFALVPGGPLGTYLALGGTTSSGAGGDTATASIERISVSGVPAIAPNGNLRVARQAPAVVELPIAGASNAVLVVVGGGASATGGTEVVIGP